MLARYAIAITAARVIPQPPIQPTQGPNVRLPHVNVVPQSGSSRLSCANATAIAIMGKNASNSTAGACSPTAMTTNPSVAVMLYAGAVAARPMMTLERRPMADPRSPLSTGSVTGRGLDWTRSLTAMAASSEAILYMDIQRIAASQVKGLRGFLARELRTP